MLCCVCVFLLSCQSIYINVFRMKSDCPLRILDRNHFLFGKDHKTTLAVLRAKKTHTHTVPTATNQSPSRKSLSMKNIRKPVNTHKSSFDLMFINAENFANMFTNDFKPITWISEKNKTCQKSRRNKTTEKIERKKKQLFQRTISIQGLIPHLTNILTKIAIFNNIVRMEATYLVACSC